MKTLLIAVFCFFAFSNVSFAASELANKAFDNKDYGVAFILYLKEARAGDAESQDMLGLMYTLGVGTKRNFPLGVLWFTLAAKNGYPDSDLMRDTLVLEWKDVILADLQTIE